MEVQINNLLKTVKKAGRDLFEKIKEKVKKDKKLTAIVLITSLMVIYFVYTVYKLNNRVNNLEKMNRFLGRGILLLKDSIDEINTRLDDLEGSVNDLMK